MFKSKFAKFNHHGSLPGTALAALLAAILLVPGAAEAARKEFWHDLRHEYVSFEYLYGVQTENPSIRLRGPNQAANDPQPEYRLTYDDAQRGWRFQLAFDFFDWIGLHFSGNRVERDLVLRDLEYDSSGSASLGDQRFAGGQTSTTVNYGLVFHTPGEIFSFDAGAAYSRVNVGFELAGTDLMLSNIDAGGAPTNDRSGLLGWMGIRFRMGDRWETDLRFYQSFYDDRYDETSMGEYSLAWAPAPKTEFRLSAFYDINSQTVRGDFGIRFYFE